MMSGLRRYKFIIFTAIIILAFASVSVAIDPPHIPDLNVTCASCHNPSVTFTYATIDNTPWNEICWQCHDAGKSSKHSDTHSAISTNDDKNQKHWNGKWTNECRRCHDPHTNEQARAYPGAYPAGAWLYTGTIQASTYNTITASGVTWDDDEWIGKTLHPKTGLSFLYMIVDNTQDTLVVAGNMYPFIRMAGGTFAISYGKLIRRDFNAGRGIINSGGVVFDTSPFRTVKFLNSSGPSSGAIGGKDTEVATDAICVVCHTQTRHMNIGVAKYGDSFDNYKVYSHYYSDIQSCWGTDCHNNSVKGFGASCLNCHGYAPTQPGALIDNDAPNGPTGRVSPGAHELHYDEKYYECTVCHEGGSPQDNGEHNTDPPRLQIGFNVFGNKGGTYTAPPLSNGYLLINGNEETTVTTLVASPMTCSGIYCHSTAQADGGTGAPTFGTPVWDGSVVCGECHKSDGVQGNASKMDTGGHAAHVSEGGVGCNNCHSDNNHVDGNVDVTSSLSYSSGGPPGNGYGSCATEACHMEIQWGNGACIDCHATAQGDRVAITPQFSANSHHVQGGTIAQSGSVTNEDCYQCHWEAKSDGRIDPLYHGGSDDSPDRSVDLVVYKPDGTRPTISEYNEGTTAVKFTADGTRAEFAKLNTHCLGCHSDSTKGVDIFGDGKSPDYYAWDTPKTSIASRYSQTGTAQWGKYSDNSKNTQTKAYSAHGAAGSNERGWNTSETWPDTSGTAKVLCFDCHNAHGSTVLGTTTSYANMNTPNGAILKDTTAGEGGYSMAYQPQAGGTAPIYNAGAGLCFDCHLTAAEGAKPWGYSGTFGATQSIMGYYDTQYFGLGTSGSEQRYGYKTREEMGGHFGASSGLANAASYEIGGLCTPCHDPHGISNSVGIANKPYALPLLKGTWVTSPYKEDRAPANDAAGTVRTDRGKEGVGYHRTPDVTQSDTQFAGLCLKCHPKNKLTDGTDTVNGSWKSIDRIHESVKGWKLTNINHRYSCSKCHAPHNANLPRLMVTNCLDKRHKGRVVSNNSPVLFGTGWGEYDGMESADCYGYASSLGRCGWSGDSGWGRGNFPGFYEQHPGTLPNKNPGRISACHASENGSWDDQSWNGRTGWAGPTLASPTSIAITNTTATLGANLTDDGGRPITERGTVWGTEASPISNALAEGGTGLGVFSHGRSGLPAGTKIYYRGYAKNTVTTGYSPYGSFYTEPSTQASGVNFTSVGSTSMIVNWVRGNGSGVIVLMKQGSAVSSAPADGTYTGYLANSAFGSGTQIGSGNYVISRGTSSSVLVSGLSPGITYYVAVFEYSGTEDTSGSGLYQGTNYKPSPETGNQTTITTPPVLTSPTATAINDTTATLGANIISDGGVAITERGTVWDTLANPTGNALAEGGTGTGIFSHARSGLPAGTKIYYRGYATNGVGTGYSPGGSFFTEPLNQASGVNFPSVGATGITVNWTRGDGTGVIVLMKQGSAVSNTPDDGTYTGYVANPTFGSGTQIGSGNYVVFKGSGSSVSINGLSPGTTYFVAVYEYSGAINTSGVNQGTNYLLSPATGNITTNLAPPTVNTPTATAITSSTATLGANVIANGASPVTERGTYWGTESNPISNALAEGGTGMGVFSHGRSGLPASTKIYYRGYATNVIGTANSPVGSFYTEPSTQASGVNFSSIGSTGMTVNWTRGSGNGVIVLMKMGTTVNANPADGIYTGYVAHPTFGSGTQLGSGNYVVYKGSDSSVSVNGLSAGTTYYVAVFEYTGTVNTSGVNLGTNYKLSPATSNGTTATTGDVYQSTFNYTGTVQSLDIPAGVTNIQFTLKGAGGGGGRRDMFQNDTNGQNGHLVIAGYGTSGVTVDVYVGGGGAPGSTSNSGAPGGWGYTNGSPGDNGDYYDSYDWAYGGAGGGGSSAIVLGPTRLAEAAGGAGGDSDDYADWEYSYGGDGGAGGGSDYPSTTSTTGGGAGGVRGTAPTAGGNGQVVITYETPGPIPPSQPVLQDEPNTICAASCDVTFQWNAVTVPDADPAEYYVQVDDDPNFGSVDFSSGTWIGTTSWTVNIGPTNKTWYWQVQARDTVHTSLVSAWAVSDSFMISDGDAPPQVSLTAPSNNYTFYTLCDVWSYSVGISWTAVPPLAEYKVQINNLSDFSGASNYESTWLSGTSWTKSLPVGTWWVRVLARDTVSLDTALLWSDPRRFYINYGGDCASSCPVFYTWNGSEYATESDLFSRAILGRKSGSTFRRPNPHDYYMLAHEPAEKDGYYEFKYVEERTETDYLDNVKIFMVDIPEDRNVYTEMNLKGDPTYFEPSEMLHTVDRVERRVVSAVHVNTGQDVSAKIESSDGDYLVLNDDKENVDWHSVELDLGDLSGAPMVKLIINGVTAFPRTTEGRNRIRSLAGSTYNKLEVMDEYGNWVLVPSERAVMTNPVEFPRPIVIDITNAFVTNIYKIRLSYIYMTYIDSITFDTTADEPIEINEMQLVSADLGHYGFSEHVPVYGEIYDYDYGNMDDRAPIYMPGYYTRFGDVALLLASTDDKFVIFGSGDEITLKFALPAPADEGKWRRFLLYGNGYYKALKVKDIPRTVELLPFAEMSNFPYDPAVENYPDDAEHNQYILEYNTREQ